MKVVLDNIGSFTQSAISTINRNNDRLEAAIETLLSRNGTTPNQMEADLDLNHYALLNVGEYHIDELIIGDTVLDEATLNTLIGSAEIAQAAAEVAVDAAQSASASAQQASDIINSIVIDIEEVQAAAEIAVGAMTTLVDPQFPTHASVLSFVPQDPAPSYLRSSGYLRTGDGGGIIWEKVNTDAGTYGITLTDENGDPVYYRRAMQVATPQQFGAVADGATDDSAALQAFFSFCGANRMLFGLIAGTFRIFSPVTLSANQTRTYVCNAMIQPRWTLGLYPGEGALNITAGSMSFPGRLDIWGNSSNWATRQVDDGLVISGSHNSFDSVGINYVRRWGVNSLNGGTGTRFNKLRGQNCGSGENYNPTTVDILSYTNSGTPTSPTRYSEAILDSIPTHIEANNSFILIDGQAFIFETIDLDTNTVRFFPQLPGSFTSGEVRLVAGGVWKVAGGDSSNCAIGTLSALSCGMALRSNPLYPPSIDMVSSQALGISIALGATKTAASLTGNINVFYAEDALIDILKVSRAADKFVINSMLHSTGAMPRVMSLDPDYSMQGMDIPFTTRMARRAGTGVSTSVSIAPTQMAIEKVDRDIKTINLVADGGAWNRLYRMDEAWIIAHGTTGPQPTGAWTIQAEVGYTVNGGTSVVYTSWPSGTNVIRAKLVGTNWEVTRMTMPYMLQASVTYNWPSLAANSTQSTTVNIADAAMGDFVQVSLSVSLQGTRIWGEVTSAGVVTIYQRNDTAGAIDVASGTLRVIVTKQ